MKPGIIMAAGLALALASCGNPPKREEPQGQLARAAMDKATADYADCVDKAAREVPLEQFRSGDVQAGTAATNIIKGCADVRKMLIGKVYEVRRIGYPHEPESTSESVAVQSVDAIEGTLREHAVVTIVSRQVGSDAEPAAPAPAPSGEKTN